LEAVVFANRVADRLRFAPPSGKAGGSFVASAKLAPEARKTLRNAMSAKAGVVRDAVGLTSLIETIEGIAATCGETNELVSARLIATSALAREESRGGHYRSDFPDTIDPPTRSFVTVTSPHPVGAPA
jgi:L-aspartate oxidase